MFRVLFLLYLKSSKQIGKNSYLKGLVLNRLNFFFIRLTASGRYSSMYLKRNTWEAFLAKNNALIYQLIQENLMYLTRAAVSGFSSALTEIFFVKDKIRFNNMLLRMYKRIRRATKLLSKSLQKSRYAISRYNTLCKHIEFIKEHLHKRHKAFHKTPLKFMSYKFKNSAFTVSRSMAKRVLNRIIYRKIRTHYR